jgi:hypothetical protein
MASESAFVDLAAPPVTSAAESAPNVRSSLGRTLAHEASRRDDALLKLLSQLDSKPKITDVQEPDKPDSEETRSVIGLHFNSIDWAFALFASGRSRRPANMVQPSPACQPLRMAIAAAGPLTRQFETRN